MNKIENIEHYFIQDDTTYGSFDCPNCETTWGHSRYCDPPGDIVEKVKCTCGAIIQVMGEWVTQYIFDVQLENDKRS